MVTVEVTVAAAVVVDVVAVAARLKYARQPTSSSDVDGC